MSLSPGAHSSARGEEIPAAQYSRLARLYALYFQLEEGLFDTLTFRLAGQQLVKTDRNFKLKLTLIDNHGEHWIFKEKVGRNPILAHKIYALFGVENPEIHAVEIILNGKPVKGTLQKYIFPAHTLATHQLNRISPRGLNYLMKTQILDWLMRDHDALSRHFLVLSRDKNNEIDRLMRVDQDCACLDSEICDLDHSSMIAAEKDTNSYKQNNIYYLIRQAYVKKKTILNLPQAYTFVKFVADFPEPLFETIVWSVKASDQYTRGENEIAALEKKYAFFWNGMSMRKRMLEKDFENFCSGITLPLADNNRYSDNQAVLSLIVSTSGDFKKQITALSRKKRGIRALPSKKPIEINAVISPDGLKILREFYKVYWRKEKNIRAACFTALRALKKLRATTTSLEKKAIDIYTEELKNILREKKTRFYPLALNKMVNSAVGSQTQPGR